MDGILSPARVIDGGYQLDDNLTRIEGRVFLTGTQALARLLLTQKRLDAARGLNTAGFVSGYRGSPLGGVDLTLWRHRDMLIERHIRFLPAINEEMAATAVMGTQRAGTRADRTVDGVFGLWYGKGPGLDRAGDALHHGTAAGASRHGGVLVVAGDDHSAVSSSIPHASEPSMINWRMPIVHPASVEEYETFGLWGLALSRYAGTWVGFKAISETVESGRAFALVPPANYLMDDAESPVRPLEYDAGNFLSLAVESMMSARLAAVRAFARRHSIDTVHERAPHAEIGIVTVGKAHLDVIDVLARLGLSGPGSALPIRIYRPGLVWPLDAERLREFARGLRHILVVEEKTGVVETQVKDLLFNLPARPTVCGKRDLQDRTLIARDGQLRPALLAEPIVRWLQSSTPYRAGNRLAAFACQETLANDADGMLRKPYFCSGCPHSTSTRIPAGSEALAGVGCHYMAAWMDRGTGGLTQMGGEGVDWLGLAPYIGMPHVFQNMGEGTYFHSGYLAIRQSIAAGASITYKILFNDAVAMTGGQPVDGPISVPAIVRQMRGEGVRHIVVTTDEPEKYRGVALEAGVRVHHRRELDRLQRELREIRGVTVLIHDQTCAAEKRRRRKKKNYPDPALRLAINTAVCEGCGDCGVQSNCLSIVPLETPLGRKRAIDQSSCNKDYSCADGFCPSFVSVIGARPKRRATSPAGIERMGQRLAGLPEPPMGAQPARYSLLVAGMGGTGVITIGALVTMAAHLEGRAASVLDLTGLAQKGGTVISHVRLGDPSLDSLPVRVDWGQADTAILCDPLASIAPDALGALRRGHTRVVANTHMAPPSDFTRDADAMLEPHAPLAKMEHAAGAANIARIDAHGAATALFGDSILSNIFMLGYAWQKGWVPVSAAALRRAIELNGVAVEQNNQAFDAGRLCAHDPSALEPAPAREQVVRITRPETLDTIVARAVSDLTAYQNPRYAARYRHEVEQVARHESAIAAGASRDAAGGVPRPRLAPVFARYLHKLMAYKDEYEVARLFTDGSFARQLAEQFEGDYSLRFHMAPPLLARRDRITGRPRKISMGPWVQPAFAILAKLRGLRGSWFDPFGHTLERRTERALVEEYVDAIASILPGLSSANLDKAVGVAGLPERIRGYGHIKLGNISAYRESLAAGLRGFAGEPLPQAPVRSAHETLS